MLLRLLPVSWVLVALGLALPGCTSAAATTHYLSPSGSDTAPCTSSDPCRSFNRGYRVAGPGDVVLVAGGTYDNQTINDDPSKDGAVPEVVIRAAPGASVTIGDLLSTASNVRYADVTVDLAGHGQPDIRGGHDVVVENVRATNFYVHGPTRNVTILGGEYGPFISEGGGSQISSLTLGGDDPDPKAQPHNTVVDGVLFHDYDVPAGSSAHLDCLHVFFHVGVTVRNSRFVRCKHYGILLGSNGPGAAEHDLIENNFFGEAGVAGFAFRGGAGEDFDDVVVRNNSGGLITPQTTNALRSVRWIANAASDIGPCRDGITYRQNVSTETTCGATDLQANPSFVDPSSGDFHLRAGSPAIDRGDPASYPVGDIDGHARFTGAAPDAGAHEFGATRRLPPGSYGPTGSDGGSGAPPGSADAPSDVRVVAGALTARVSLAGSRLRVTRDGLVRLLLRCTGLGARCRLDLGLHARLGGGRQRRVAHRTATIAAGRSVGVRLRLTRRARKVLEQRRTLRATLRVEVKVGRARNVVTRTVALRRP